MNKGFTLIELLVVIAIVAVLAAAVVLTLNPAELLRQTRDATRLSDLATIRSALALYLADVSTPAMGTATNCYVNPAIGAGSGCLTRFAGGTNTIVASVAIDGTGWVPVNLTGISSGPPISSYPTDPVNNTTALFYAYRNGGTGNLQFEVNADLESAKYIPEEGTDGGNSAGFYEVGTHPGLAL